MILKYYLSALWSSYGNLTVKVTDKDPSKLTNLIIIIVASCVGAIVIGIVIKMGINKCIKKKKMAALNSDGVPNEITPNSYASSQETFINNNNNNYNNNNYNNNQQHFPQYPQSE